MRGLFPFLCLLTALLSFQTDDGLHLGRCSDAVLYNFAVDADND